jgi:multidrug efflux pump subunit AcrB
MITWFARNAVAANLLMISIVMAGLFSLSTQIPLEVFPSFETDRISVSVSLRGGAPEDVEQGVTVRIEEAVQDLEGIKEISSRSSESSSQVTIEVDSGYDAREILADIKSRVDAINTFPADAEKPVIALAQRRREVLAVSIAAPYSEKEIKEFAEQIRDELLLIDGITQVDLSGVRNYEITIEISQSKLQQFNLSISDVANIIDSFSIDVSAGNLKTTGGDVLIRTKAQAYHKDEFVDIPIKTNPDGSVVRLKDIANITDDFEESPVRTRFNGEQAAFLDVYRIGQQSAIEVADSVKQYIEDKQSSLPEGFKLSYWDDNSEVVKSRISTLTTNAMQGGILVLLLLTLFLRPSIAFWVFLGIPVCFLGAFIFMPFMGVTINIMSLFGFILVLGIVVDDAIVTGENIYTHLKTAESSEEAAIKGTKEVATPVTFGILTTVAAFLPLAFIDGNRGAIFAQIPYVVIPVLLLSLVESKFVLPAHLKMIKLRSEKTSMNKFERFQQRFADGFESAILKYYQPILKRALAHKMTTLSLFCGIFLVIAALISSGWTKFVFFPRIPSETVRASLTMPSGTPFDVTHQYIELMTNHALTLQEKYRDENSEQSLITNVLATTGGRGGTTNVGSVRFEILSPEERTIDLGSPELVKEWREMIGSVPGAELLTFRAELGRSSDPIDIQLSAKSLTTLSQVADKVKERLATYPTVFEIADSLSDGKEELRIELTQAGKVMGLSLSGVSQQVRNAFFGSEVQRIQRGSDDVRVMIRLPLSERSSIATLQSILIKTPTGNQVPLSHVATLSPNKSPSTIYRVDRFRTVSITADLDKTSTNMTALQNDIDSYLAELVGQYPGMKYSMKGETEEQRESFGSLGYALIFVFFVIYCLLAIPFKSYTQPIIVMSVIPFGMIGAVMGHWLMGMDLTIFSLLGMMALIGVVVNDSLVLVDYINKKRATGMPSLEAALIAGAARFRPVMLTSLTTFIGLMPLLFEKSTQAQFLIPMAVSLGFGILFATLITLLLVPVNYMLLDKIFKYK